MFLKNNPTIRYRLARLVTACLVPVWLLAAVLVWQAYVSKLDEVNRDLLQNARITAMVVDRELGNVQAALQTLATSPSFQQKDFAAIHSQSLDILKNFPGADIILANETGQQQINTFRTYGSPLPKRGSLATVDAVFRTGRPLVSNLYFGAVTKRPVIAVDVPVFLGGRVAYDLYMSFPSATLSSILQGPNSFEGWYCSILDRNAVIVARTRNVERFVGKPVDAVLRAALKDNFEGTVDSVNSEGEEVLAGFSKLNSGWAVAFGVPKAAVMREVYRWMAWAAGGAAAISLIGFVLAMRMAHKVAGEIQALVPPALAIGRGEAVTGLEVGALKETSEVADALLQASRLLQQRSAERELAENQLSLAMDDLKRETAERIRAMEELRKNEQLLLQQSRQAALGEMVGNIAHQWRQPLNTLGLLVQQPPLFYELGEVDKQYLIDNSEKSMQLIKHMSQTIDDFRNFFKPDKEKMSFRLHQEVAKTLSLVDGSFKAQQTQIEMKVAAEPVVEGYPNEFSQALLNILINARDAFAERSVASPRIVISIGAASGKAVLTVTDNAGGIPDEIMHRIFDPYFTTKGPQAGTGVGLFMSKTIIEKNMGGTLTARNVDGGAEFRIEL